MRLINNSNSGSNPILTGALLVLFAILLFAKPVGVFIGLTLLFGWMILISGIANLRFYQKNQYVFQNRKGYLYMAVAETLTGILLLLLPAKTAGTAIVLIGIWLIISSVSRIRSSLRLKKLGFLNYRFSLYSGVLSLIFGLIIAANPVVAMQSLVYLLAIPVFIIGLLFLFFGLQLRKFNNF